MTETKTRKKRRKKQQSTVWEEQQTQESQNIAEIAEVLEELEKQGKHLDIQVCPKCKSPRVRRAKTDQGDLLGHMGWLPPKFECRECGWRERTVLKATNKPTTVRDVVIIAEAKDAHVERKRKEKR